jgi:hypothetical protein
MRGFRSRGASGDEEMRRKISPPHKCEERIENRE